MEMTRTNCSRKLLSSVFF